VSTPGSPGATPGVTVQGQVETHDREQDTIGTIGKGRVEIGDKAHSTALDTINRDTKVTQVITKDESAGTKVYGSSSAVQTIASTFDSIKNGVEQESRSKILEDQSVPDAVKDLLSSGKVTLLDLAYAVKTLQENGGEPGSEAPADVKAVGDLCGAQPRCTAAMADALARLDQKLSENPDFAQYTQAGGIKKMGDGPLLAAALANGFKTIHEMKDEYKLDSKSNIGVDRQGNLYRIGVKAVYVPIPLGLKASGE